MVSGISFPGKQALELQVKRVIVGQLPRSSSQSARMEIGLKMTCSAKSAAAALRQSDVAYGPKVLVHVSSGQNSYFRV